jgi:hypothetical protein
MALRRDSEVFPFHFDGYSPEFSSVLVLFKLPKKIPDGFQEVPSACRSVPRGEAGYRT